MKFVTNKVKGMTRKGGIVRAIVCLVVSVLLVGGSFGAIAGVTYSEIKAANRLEKVEYNLKRTQTIQEAKAKLTTIASNQRIVDILAIDINGEIVYSIKDAHEVGKIIEHDTESKMLRYQDATKTAYFSERDEYWAMVNLGDDDDHHIRGVNKEFIEMNTYKTIIMTEKATGAKVLVVCTQDTHKPFMIAGITSIVVWGLVSLYIGITIALIVSAYVVYRVKQRKAKPALE